MMRKLHTVGYERASVEDFIATLRKAKVSCLIDVRAVPVSRKRGFSKNILRASLEEQGIEYLHISALGDPKPGREAAKAGRYAEFRRIYKAHLRSSQAKGGLDLAARVASEVSACLLCFERDPVVCHRTLVAERVSFLTGLEVRHLAVIEGAAEDRHRAVRRNSHSRQGHTPAQPQAR